MNTAKQRSTFISYSRKDKEFALEFAREMKSASHLVWLDQVDIHTGMRWDDEVERALHECEIFLIILTPASISSENVKDEIGYAIDHGKRILPVLLEECAVPLRLRRFQYVDFTKLEFSEGVKRAKQLLENFIHERPTPGPTTALPEVQNAPKTEVTTVSSLPAQEKSLPRRWIFGGVGILALFALLGALGAMLMFRGSIFPPAPTPTFVIPSQSSDVPLIETVNVSTHPPIPDGLKEVFMGDPESLETITTTNVIKFNGLTYWAYSYLDNRNSLAIVAYDSSNNIVNQWEKSGARYLWKITVDSDNETITFHGQASHTVFMNWSDLVP
jgi:hypothetical protein